MSSTVISPAGWNDFIHRYISGSPIHPHFQAYATRIPNCEGRFLQVAQSEDRAGGRSQWVWKNWGYTQTRFPRTRTISIFHELIDFQFSFRALIIKRPLHETSSPLCSCGLLIWPIVVRPLSISKFVGNNLDYLSFESHLPLLFLSFFPLTLIMVTGKQIGC